MPDYNSPDGLDHDRISIMERNLYRGEPVNCCLCGEFLGFEDDLQGDKEHSDCRFAVDRIQAIDAHQKAFNNLPADVMVTLSIITKTYINGLSDQVNLPDNVAFWLYTLQEGLEAARK